MREIRTSGLMSGDGKRGIATAPVLDSTIHRISMVNYKFAWFAIALRVAEAIGAKPGHGGRSGGPDPRSDVLVERLDECVAHHLEPAAQIIPDRDAEFVAGLGEAQESITAVAADIAARPGTDLTAGDVAADIV